MKQNAYLRIRIQNLLASGSPPQPVHPCRLPALPKALFGSGECDWPAKEQRLWVVIYECGLWSNEKESWKFGLVLPLHELCLSHSEVSLSQWQEPCLTLNTFLQNKRQLYILVSQPKLKISKSFNIALIGEMGAAFRNFRPKLPEMVTQVPTNPPLHNLQIASLHQCHLYQSRIDHAMWSW